MVDLSWITYIAKRYMSRGGHSSPAPVLAILGIATGVLALIVIIAVMNGFQLGFIESILELSSYHIRLGLNPSYLHDEELAGQAEAAVEALEEKIRALPEVVSVVPFKEFQGLMRGKRSSQQVAVLHGVPHDALQKDGGMRKELTFEAGSFDLDTDHALLLGTELARLLGVHLGDSVTLISVSGILSEEVETEDTVFTVTGIFRSGFYEYDSSWGYIALELAANLDNTSLSLGIKLHNRWQDARTEKSIRAFLAQEPDEKIFQLRAWRDYNKAFFGALRTEKLLMFVLVGLIFIVVGLNIFQAQRRTVLERREDIGLLRAVGGGELAVRLIFVFDGGIIGLTGAGIGLILGLLIATHISAFFTLLEAVVNAIIHLINYIASGFSSAGTADFAIFSSTVFYLKEIPSRVIFGEVVLIFMFGLVSALAAAWFASGRVLKTKPADVLRYE
ncbi:MAG: ABC transporter permease [Spirochaetaceae bacterium]|jgi:lipoprotein-releasing system permease protein|nr:ABC transporter permease [Spirochaetaceae bacterium]